MAVSAAPPQEEGKDKDLCRRQHRGLRDVLVDKDCVHRATLALGAELVRHAKVTL